MRIGLPRSLTARLLSVAVIVAASAIAVTAWLTVRGTTSGIEAQQGEILSDDSRIYSTLIDYAATHGDWSGVAATVRRLAGRTGRRIVLVSQQRRTLADSAATTLPRPTTVSAVVDPLAVDPRLMPGVPADRIAVQAVGPLRLTSDTRRHLRASGGLCDRAYVNVVRLVGAHPTRPAPEADVPGPGFCITQAATASHPATFTALRDVQQSTRRCLHGTHTILLLDAAHPDTFGISIHGVQAFPFETATRQVASCVARARRTLLADSVAPPALLYVVDGSGTAPATSVLGSGNTLEIAVAGGLVLLVAVAVTALTARRLARPLRELTTATQRMRAGDTGARVPLARGSGRDELTRLGAAFNEMAASLQRAEQLRQSMVADVAHELRTPLSNIRGWLEAVQDEVASADSELIDSLHAQAVQLQHLVDDLQDLAVADAGRLTLHPVPVRVGELIAAVAAAHEAQAATGGVTLDVRPSGEQVTADPIRLEQAVGNLLTNAVRYTPAGGTVTVSARRAGRSIEIVVLDTGMGIDPDDLPNVFDRFWRADASRTRYTGGSGLGLAITRNLVRAHGGDVTVTSTPGLGSTFTITLPIDSAPP